MSASITSLIVIGIAFFAAQLAPLWAALKPFVKSADSCKQCTLVGKGTLQNSEDLTLYRHGLVFISVGALADLFGNHHSGSQFSHNGILNGEIIEAGLEPGRIYLLDVRSYFSSKSEIGDGGKPTLRELPIKDFPPDIPFQAHGIFYSNSTERMYVVSHGLSNGGSRVIVFDVRGENPESLSLVYQRSVTSPDLLLNLCPNDVVEGTPHSQHGGEIYVTQWLKYAGPIAGKSHPHTATEFLTTALQELVMFDIPHHWEWLRLLLVKWVLPARSANPSGSTVVRCAWSDLDSPAQCEEVAGGFVMANGITTDPQRSIVFVNDLGTSTVHVFKRDQDSGGLTEERGRRIELKHMSDNIEYDVGSGDLFTGSIPRPLDALKASKDGRRTRVPGGLQVLRRQKIKEEETAAGTPPLFFSAEDASFEVEGDVCTHGGEKLSGVSSALLLSEKTNESGTKSAAVAVLGSPFSNGILVCEM